MVHSSAIQVLTTDRIEDSLKKKQTPQNKNLVDSGVVSDKWCFRPLHKHTKIECEATHHKPILQMTKYIRKHHEFVPT